jgi:F-type H+-transporting ATPase subunit delta
MKAHVGTVAVRYARSLFSVAQSQLALAEVRDDLQSLGDLWSENDELVALLMNPGLSKVKVNAIISSLMERMVLHAISRKFVNLLLEKDRLEILPAVVPAFEKLWREHAGEVEVTVTTALPLDSIMQEKVRVHLAAKSGKKPLVVWKADPGIVGGVVVEWPDRVFDGSLARKLEGLREHMAETV